MAAPMFFRRLQTFGIYRSIFKNLTNYSGKRNVFHNIGTPDKRRKKIILAIAISAASIGAGGVVARALKMSVKAAGVEVERPKHKVSREIRIPTDDTGLKLTIYQYQTCPFSCKVRAFLDYHGFSYDVIEVNSVWKTQLKWSAYTKVPIVLCDGQGENGFLQVNDSSVIMSVLQSYLEDKNTPFDKLVSFYPPIISEGKRGKKVYEFPNKYNIMYGEKPAVQISTTTKQQKEERKWRRWVDDHLVHMLSPNVYRTPSEALQAFRYFSKVGEWDTNFSNFEQIFVIYVGATAMYILGKFLKHRYELKENVRESLFDACKEWTKAVGKSHEFMGGKQPNLADLSVYGVLNSIEGCDAFNEVLQNTNIGPWYNRTKLAVDNHMGTHPAHKL